MRYIPILLIVSVQLLFYYCGEENKFGTQHVYIFNYKMSVELLHTLNEIGILGFLVFVWETYMESQKEKKNEGLYHLFVENELSNILIAMKPFFRKIKHEKMGYVSIVRDKRSGNSMHLRLEGIGNEFEQIKINNSDNVKIKMYLFSQYSNEAIFFNRDEINKILTNSLFALKSYQLSIATDLSEKLHYDIDKIVNEIIKHWLSILSSCESYEKKYLNSFNIYQLNHDSNETNQVILCNVVEAEIAYTDVINRFEKVEKQINMLCDLIKLKFEEI